MSSSRCTPRPSGLATSFQNDIHHLHGIARGINGGADLGAERTPDRNAEVDRSSAAELRVDAEVLRLLAAIETDKPALPALPLARGLVALQAIVANFSNQRPRS